MTGKTVKVVEYNLSFGTNDRMVNILGLFRYKSNNTLYVVYTDVDIKYNIIYYGSSYVKENSILSMACKNKDEEEIIKEYIYKITNNEPLDNFEFIMIDTIEGIEIINSNKLEVKPEVLYQLTELLIPKKEIIEELPKKEKTTKKSNKLPFILILLVAILGGTGYMYLTNQEPKDTTIKQIICKKEYKHNTLNANITEENTYYFGVQDKLQKLDNTTDYQFLTEKDYQDFINNGTFYRYMPDDDTKGGWNKEDSKYLFRIIKNIEIDNSYSEPTTYEDVLIFYKNKGYTCEEQLKKD